MTKVMNLTPTRTSELSIQKRYAIRLRNGSTNCMNSAADRMGLQSKTGSKNRSWL